MTISTAMTIDTSSFHTAPGSPCFSQPPQLSWHESSVRSQLVTLPISFEKLDLLQHASPSIYGLRRKVAAALPQLEGTLIHPLPIQDPFFSIDSRATEHDLEAREKEYELNLLCRFELAELHTEVYTEQRSGKWMSKGKALRDAIETEDRIYSPWDVKIDSQAILSRNKLRSFVELVDSKRVAPCELCTAFDGGPASFRGYGGLCSECGGTGMVIMVYVVCVTLRQVKFLPLQLPIRHIEGTPQLGLRNYTTESLQSTAFESVNSSAYRVGLAHSKKHDARLLCVRATLSLRSCNSVVALHRQKGSIRTFDITDTKDGLHPQDVIRIRETKALTERMDHHMMVIRRTDGLFRLMATKAPPSPALRNKADLASIHPSINSQSSSFKSIKRLPSFLRLKSKKSKSQLS